MKHSVTIVLATMLAAATALTPASAKQRHGKTASKMTTGSPQTLKGNNAELGGNNGNSASGSNTISNNQGNVGR